MDRIKRKVKKKTEMSIISKRKMRKGQPKKRVRKRKRTKKSTDLLMQLCIDNTINAIT